MRKSQPEATFQKMLVKTLRGIVSRNVILFAIPNGGKRAKHEAAILVGQGQVAGMPDLMVLWDGLAAAMECKAPGGRLSDAQIDVHARLKLAGIPVAIVSELWAAVDFLKACGVPFRIKPEILCGARAA